MCNSLPALRFSDLGGLERTSTGWILWAGMNAVRLEIKKKDRASEFHYLFSHSLGALVFLVSCHCSADVLQWLPNALCTKIKRRSAAAWPASTSSCSAAHATMLPALGLSTWQLQRLLAGLCKHCASAQKSPHGFCATFSSSTLSQASFLKAGSSAALGPAQHPLWLTEIALSSFSSEQLTHSAAACSPTD